MSNKNPILILKHSSVSGKTPTTEQLEYGELTLNYNTKDPFLSFKDSDNNIVKISANPKIIIDEALSSDSNNPVANSAITKVIVENEETIAAAANDLNDKIANITDSIKKNSDKIADNTASIETFNSNPVLSATTADVVITFDDESGTTETKTIYLKG